MRFKLTFIILFIGLSQVFGQEYINQNGIQSSVVQNLTSTNDQAFRYELFHLGYNSYHWQNGGTVIIELFQQYYGTGYEKYILSNGYGQGVNIGSPELKLVETHGTYRNARVVLGQPYSLGNDYGGYENKGMAVYLT